jgi:hypothetical protein
VLLRLSYLALTSMIKFIRLLAMSNADKNIEILTLRHQGTVALAGGKTRSALEALRSEGMGEFGEGSQKPMPWVELNAVFVVATAEVLHERVPGADDSD